MTTAVSDCCCEVMGVDCGRLGGVNGELPLLDIGEATNDCAACWKALGNPVILDPKGCVDPDGD